MIDYEHVGSVIETKKEVSIAQPKAPVDLSNVVHNTVPDAEITQYVSKKSRSGSNMHQACYVMMGQCTLNIVNTLKSMNDHEAMETVVNVLPLLKLLKQIGSFLNSRQIWLMPC